MGTATLKRFILGAAFLAAVLCHAPLQARVQTFTGRAVNEAGVLAYVEKHAIAYEDGRVKESRTTYFDPDERLIGTLESTYAPMPRLSTYSFRDLRKGYTDGVRLEPGRICMFRKRSLEAEEEIACRQLQGLQIAGQGFHHFIVNRLDAIAEGEVFHVELALPSRLDQARFRIRRHHTEGDRLWIRLEIDNWVLRLFAPRIDVAYDRKAALLLRYVGASNVSDASGQRQKVEIRYTYPAGETKNLQ